MKLDGGDEQHCDYTRCHKTVPFKVADVMLCEFPFSKSFQEGRGAGEGGGGGRTWHLGDSILQPSSCLRVDGHATCPPIAGFSLCPATTCHWLASRVLTFPCSFPVSPSPPSSRTFIPQPRKCPLPLPPGSLPPPCTPPPTPGHSVPPIARLAAGPRVFSGSLPLVGRSLVWQTEKDPGLGFGCSRAPWFRP